MPEDNPDFVTILPTFYTGGELFCVAVRTYQRATDDYISKRCSEPMRKTKAEALASSWAAALGVEVR